MSRKPLRPSLTEELDHEGAGLALMGLGLTQSALEPGLKESLLQRIMLRIAADAPAKTTTIRSSVLDWQPAGLGVDIKVLRFDSVANHQTVLIRMQAASRVVGHAHSQTEECFVLAGEVYIGAHRLTVGDLHVAEPGAIHPSILAPLGALLMIRSEIPPASFQLT
jgi:quercetin dioxygenase-like cupin family protein